jgi:hypothetical protein
LKVPVIKYMAKLTNGTNKDGADDKENPALAPGTVGFILEQGARSGGLGHKTGHMRKRCVLWSAPMIFHVVLDLDPAPAFGGRRARKRCTA